MKEQIERPKPQICRLSNPLKKIGEKIRSKSVVCEKWITNHFRLTPKFQKTVIHNLKKPLLTQQKTLKFDTTYHRRHESNHLNINNKFMRIYGLKADKISNNFKSHSFNFFKGKIIQKMNLDK